jgi:hypothetical protein
MTAFAILRVAKLKTLAQVAAVGGHNSRSRETPNADAGRRNHAFRRADDAPGAVMQRIAAAGVKPRKDAVIAMEMLLSASPEYFRPGREGEAGVWDAKKLDQWANDSWRWMKETYGDRIIRADLHLDESTPHIQAIIVPITDDNRLSAKEMFGKIQLKHLQTTYAKAVEKLGIKRGIEGSKAKHSKIQQFYNVATAPLPPEPAPVRALKVKTPPLMLTEQTREDWAAEQSRAAAANAERENRRYRQEIGRVVKKGQVADLAQRRVAEMQETIQALSNERDAAVAAAKKAQEKAEAAALRDIPLERVISAYGLESDPTAIRAKPRWIGEGHVIRLEGRKWYDDGAERAHGTGSIDLVKHLAKCDYSQALAWLRDKVGTAQAAEAHALRQKDAAVDTTKAAIAAEFEPPTPNPWNWPRVKKYLTDVRKLPEYLINRLHEKSMIYADDRYNAVFKMFDSKGRTVGAELKGSNIHSPFTGLAPGSKRIDGQFVLPVGAAPTKVVVTEAAIDAISYASTHQVDKDGYIVVSTSGARSTLEWLDEMLARELELVVAYDNDKTGNAKADNLIAAYRAKGGKATRERPPAWCKDWNDMLTSSPPASKAEATPAPAPAPAPAPG